MDIFLQIEDKMGMSLEANRSFQVRVQMVITCMMVNMDTREGLIAALNIPYRGMANKKILEYEFIPFYCQRCHKVGEFLKDCMFPYTKKRGMKSPFVSHTGRNDVEPSTGHGVEKLGIIN